MGAGSEALTDHISYYTEMLGKTPLEKWSKIRKNNTHLESKFDGVIQAQALSQNFFLYSHNSANQAGTLLAIQSSIDPANSESILDKLLCIQFKSFKLKFHSLALNWLVGRRVESALNAASIELGGALLLHELVFSLKSTLKYSHEYFTSLTFNRAQSMVYPTIDNPGLITGWVLANDGHQQSVRFVGLSDAMGAAISGLFAVPVATVLWVPTVFIDDGRSFNGRRRATDLATAGTEIWRVLTIPGYPLLFWSLTSVFRQTRFLHAFQYEKIELDDCKSPDTVPFTVTAVPSPVLFRETLQTSTAGRKGQTTTTSQNKHQNQYSINVWPQFKDKPRRRNFPERFLARDKQDDIEDRNQ
ncbi:hypothetical protein C8R44DRAFT_740405 [Mycena epipterygia]|nr:hypothetical protein C8R44DRAFT_740405 [Mycena epipterygia]